MDTGVDIDAARVCAGISFDELYWAYLLMGGILSKPIVSEYLLGRRVAVPSVEHDMLARAAVRSAYPTTYTRPERLDH